MTAVFEKGKRYSQEANGGGRVIEVLSVTSQSITYAPVYGGAAFMVEKTRAKIRGKMNIDTTYILFQDGLVHNSIEARNEVKGGIK